MSYQHSINVSSSSQDVELEGDMREYNETYRPLRDAAFIGDWEAAKLILDQRPELVRKSITTNRETLLHLAASAQASKLTETFLENLVNMMRKEDLELVDLHSLNAFLVAVANGSIKMVQTMLQKNEDLLIISTKKDYFPITLSAYYGHHDLTMYLYKASEGKMYMESADLQYLVHHCMKGEMFDITFKLMEDYRHMIFQHTIAIILDGLARRPNSLNRPEQNIIWKNIGRFFVKLHMKKEPSENEQHQALKLLKLVLNKCTKLPLSHQLDILKGPCEPGKRYILPSGVLFVAAEMGNTAFLIEFLQVYPHLLSEENENGESIFHVAIKLRHRGIYNLLYEIGKKRLLTTQHINAEGNTMLHVVAKSSKENQLHTTSGASLQMQRELLWFQAVEKMLPPALREKKNNKGETAYQLFLEENKDLISGGLKWMKDCMVTATLIVTVAFAVAFTVPGGYNQETGFPIFLHETSFLVFVIADAISLFSSSTSLLVFLSILTSGYGQRDFLNSLPQKLMIGLLALFISVVAMMITFAASFFVLYHNGLKWVPIVISILGAIPVISFAILQFPVWLDMFRSTFDPRYLFNPRRRMLYNNRRGLVLCSKTTKCHCLKCV